MKPVEGFENLVVYDCFAILSFFKVSKPSPLLIKRSINKRKQINLRIEMLVVIDRANFCVKKLKTSVLTILILKLLFTLI